MKRLFISLPLLHFMLWTVFLGSESHAQKQANVWHFGVEHSLDFSSGEPVQVSGSAIFAYEGCASYCDSLGNLLFYTNGGGYETLGTRGNIWNAYHQSIYDMQGIEGGGYSAMQSSVFVEAPGELGKYYLFTMDDREFFFDASDSIMNVQPQGRGLSYYKIDQAANNDSGGVIEHQQVYAPSAEALCAVRHTNKSDYWILINQDTSGVGVYSLSENGVQLSSVFEIPLGTFYLMKVSPDGSKVFVLLEDTTFGTGVLLDFNPTSGTLSNPQILSTMEGIFYFEFSPNSKYLYFANGNNMGRYDVSSDNVAATFSNPFNFSGISNFWFISHMQLGPDGNIYVLFFEDDPSNDLPINTLSRIVCPNKATPNFDYAVFTYIGTNETGQFNGLPNFPSWLFENYDSTFVSLGPDIIRLCDMGDTLVLNAQNPGANYQWSTGSTEQTITITQPGTYSVTVNGTCGAGSDEIVVLPCENCIITTATFSETACQSYTAPWGAVYSESGSYSDTLLNASGCDSVITLHLTVHSLPNTDATPEIVSIALGDSVQLNASGGVTYSWSPTESLSCSNCASPLAFPSQGTTYVVAVTDSAGCTQSDTLRVEVDIICNEVFIPTIFSPNGKGPQANETFCVFSDCVEQFKLVIHNRWGERIFESEDINQCWDGTFKGVEAASGVYAFNVYLKQLDGRVLSKAGTVELVK